METIQAEPGQDIWFDVERCRVVATAVAAAALQPIVEYAYPDGGPHLSYYSDLEISDGGRLWSYTAARMRLRGVQALGISGDRYTDQLERALDDLTLVVISTAFNGRHRRPPRNGIEAAELYERYSSQRLHFERSDARFWAA